MIFEIIAAFWFGLGVIISIASIVGMYRLPDVYSRIHAAGKITTVGVVCFIIGAGFLNPQWIPKLLVLATFIVLVNPVSGHAIAKAAISTGVPMQEGAVRNDYAEVIREKNPQ